MMASSKHDWQYSLEGTTRLLTGCGLPRSGQLTILGRMTGLTTLFLCQACFHAQMHVVEAIISRPTGVMKLKEASRLITVHYDTLLEGWRGDLLARETWSSPTDVRSIRDSLKLDTSQSLLNTRAWIGRLPSNRYRRR